MATQTAGDVSPGLLEAVRKARLEVSDTLGFKEGVRGKLLEYMSQCAREISRDEKTRATYSGSMGVKFNGKWPRCFSPGVFERRIFNRIIDPHLEEITDYVKTSSSRDITKSSTLMRIATNLMVKWYYPDYGEWDRTDFEDAAY